jgi:hypothetical protein
MVAMFCAISGILHVSTSWGIRFEPDSLYRRIRARCADRDIRASSGACCHGDSECCLQRASEFCADSAERIAGRGPCIQVTAVAATTRSQEMINELEP